MLEEISGNGARVFLLSLFGLVLWGANAEVVSLCAPTQAYKLTSAAGSGFSS